MMMSKNLSPKHSSGPGKKHISKAAGGGHTGSGSDADNVLLHDLGVKGSEEPHPSTNNNAGLGFSVAQSSPINNNSNSNPSNGYGSANSSVIDNPISPSFIRLAPNLEAAVEIHGGFSSLDSHCSTVVNVENTESMVGGPTIGQRISVEGGPGQAVGSTINNRDFTTSRDTNFTDVSDATGLLNGTPTPAGNNSLTNHPAGGGGPGGMVGERGAIAMVHTNLEGLHSKPSSGSSSGTVKRVTSTSQLRQESSLDSSSASPHVGGGGGATTAAHRCLVAFKSQYADLQGRFLGLSTDWAQHGRSVGKAVPKSDVKESVDRGGAGTGSDSTGLAVGSVDMDYARLMRPTTGEVAANELSSVTAGGFSKAGFDDVSKEMLVDYCWEVHRSLAKALHHANLLTEDDDVNLDPRLSSSHPATAQSTSSRITTGVAGGENDKAWRPELNKGPAAHPRLRERAKQATLGGSVAHTVTSSAARSPQPPSNGGPPRSGVGAPHSRASPRLASAATMASNNSLQSIVRPPVSHTFSAVTVNDPDQPGSMLNDYVLLAQIGAGCYGVVRQAFHTVENKLFAVKVLSRGPMHQPLHPSYNLQGQPQHVPVQQGRDLAVQREIAVMKKLRHQNIVGLHEVIDDPQLNNLYLILQYVDQGAVGSVGPDMVCTTRLDPTTMANYGRQICAGLQYLHNHNVVHRDIKPDNILKDSRDTVYLADFGVSEMFDAPPASSSSVAADGRAEENVTTRTQVAGRHGTPAFMAPELLTHETNVEHDGKALDVWALGVTFYCFLVGYLPFRSRQEIVLGDLALPEELPFEWAALLMQMLQKDPQKRPMINEIRQMVKSLDVAAKKDEDERAAGHQENSTVPADEVELASAFTPRTSSVSSSAFSSVPRRGGVPGGGSPQPVGSCATHQQPVVAATARVGRTTSTTAAKATVANNKRVIATPSKALPVVKVAVSRSANPSSPSVVNGETTARKRDRGGISPRKSGDKPSTSDGTSTQQPAPAPATASTSAIPSATVSQQRRPSAPTAPQQPHTGRPVSSEQRAVDATRNNSATSSSAVPTLPPMSTPGGSINSGNRSSTSQEEGRQGVEVGVSGIMQRLMPAENPVISTARGATKTNTALGGSSTSNENPSGVYYANPSSNLSPPGGSGAKGSKNKKKWAGVQLPKLGVDVASGHPPFAPSGSSIAPPPAVADISRGDSSSKPPKWRKPSIAAKGFK